MKVFQTMRLLLSATVIAVGAMAATQAHAITGGLLILEGSDAQTFHQLCRQPHLVGIDVLQPLLVKPVLPGPQGCNPQHVGRTELHPPGVLLQVIGMDRIHTGTAAARARFAKRSLITVLLAVAVVGVTGLAVNRVSTPPFHSKVYCYSSIFDGMLLMIDEGEGDTASFQGGDHLQLQAVVDWLLTQAFEQTGVRVADEPLAPAIVGFPFHRGALAVGKRPAAESLASALAPQTARDRLRWVVYPEIAKPENMGSFCAARWR